MDERIQQLRERQVEIRSQIEGSMAAAEAEKRDITTDELSAIDALEVEFDRAGREIASREEHLSKQAALNRPRGRQTAPAPTPADDDGDQPAARRSAALAAAPRLPAEPRDRRCGFRNFGEYALSVFRAGQDGSIMDRRLEQLAPTTYANEGSGSDGGFAIPPDFRTEIVQKVMNEDSLISRTDQLTTSGNSLTIPVDETEPWSTSGVRAYWTGEGALKTPSKPQLTEKTFKLHKLAALVNVTDELLEDAPALDRYLRMKVPSVFTYEINEAILFGNGVGKPLGAVNGPAKVQVAKETSQTADTVVYANVAKMWNRMYGASRRNAVWLVNQDVEPQIEQMYLPTGSNSGALVYMPPGGVSGAPYGTIKGRPVIPVENLKALGDEGDIILWDPSTYMTLTKQGGGGMKTDVSIHLYFDYDITAFRFVMRIGGQNWWGSAVARANGSNTLSNVVTLAERA